MYKKPILPLVHLRAGTLIVAFILQLGLQNICLMGQVQAAESTPKTPQISREMPKSPAAFNCPWAKQRTGTTTTEKSPCESGQCIKSPAPQVPCTHAGTQEIQIQTPPLQSVEPIFTADTSTLYLPQATESPPYLEAVATVVLRR